AVGRWGAMRVGADSFEGRLVTIALVLEETHGLTVDVDGLKLPGSALAAAVLVPAAGDVPMHAAPGYDFSACDPVLADGRAVPVSWRGRGLEQLGPGRFHLAVCMSGAGLRLFGMDLVR